jgi:hypothetical protein
MTLARCRYCMAAGRPDTHRTKNCPIDQSRVMKTLRNVEQEHDTEEVGTMEANLGMATTAELLKELAARIEVGHLELGYRTIDGD